MLRLSIASIAMAWILAAASPDRSPVSHPVQSAALGYGRCHENHCSCFRFEGGGATCTRYGCKHDYGLHY